MEKLLAERKFVIDAPQERIWNLLGMVIFDSLAMERFHARDDRNFNGLTKVKVAFVTIAMQLKGTIVDISPPEALSVLVEATAMGKIIHLKQKIMITLDSVGRGKSEFICKVVREGRGSVLTVILTPRARSFASGILESIERRLRQLA